MRELANAGGLILPSASILHNVRFPGLPVVAKALRLYEVGDLRGALFKARRVRPSPSWLSGGAFAGGGIRTSH
jgi:hypothetical protein